MTLISFTESSPNRPIAQLSKPVNQKNHKRHLVHNKKPWCFESDKKKQIIVTVSTCYRTCWSLNSKRESLCVIRLDCFWMTKGTAIISKNNQKWTTIIVPAHHRTRLSLDGKRDFDSLRTTKASDHYGPCMLSDSFISGQQSEPTVDSIDRH